MARTVSHTLILVAGGVVALILLLGIIGQASAPNVAVIPISGVIGIDASSGLLGGAATSSTQTVRFLQQADNDPSIKAVVLEINSPGGSAVASDEIANAVSDMHKPVVAWIRESGASGAYWIASRADWIIANRMSITGSVGVIASYLDFSGFLKDHNVTYERLVAGQYKDIGSPLTNLTPEEKALLQQKLDTIHQYFIQDVAKHRNLTPAEVGNISSGIFFLGSEAKNLGLVDELGGRDQVVAWLQNKTGSKPVFQHYQVPQSFLQALFSSKAQFPGLTQGLHILS